MVECVCSSIRIGISDARGLLENCESDWYWEYYTFLALIMEVFVTGMLYSFGNNNSKRPLSCSCIGMGLVTHYMGLRYWMVLVTGMLYSFAIIIETIEFCFSFGISLEIYEALKIDIQA